jgi:hypothetical protein
MAEIYRDATGKAAVLGVTGATVTKVEFKRDGELVSQTVASPAEIPYAITHQDGEFDVVWTYTVGGTEYTRTETFNVVTPLFTADDLEYDTILSSLPDAQKIKLEATVRRLIESYCGQSFGYREGWVTMRGSNGLYISPEKILSLDSSGIRIGAAGFAINISPIYGVDYNIKVPAEEEAYHYGYVPTNNWGSVMVKGTFGWVSIPDEVKEAALILAEELACDESMWRDRYIKSIRAADWRFDFTDGAFQGTGSVAADQLLSKFVVIRAAFV